LILVGLVCFGLFCVGWFGFGWFGLASGFIFVHMGQFCLEMLGGR
jgi:hypothetical protein